MGVRSSNFSSKRVNKILFAIFKVSEKLLSSMRRTCTSRFEFLDLRLFDFVNQTNSFFQALSGSLAKLVPDLPDVEAPRNYTHLVEIIYFIENLCHRLLLYPYFHDYAVIRECDLKVVIPSTALSAKKGFFDPL